MTPAEAQDILDFVQNEIRNEGRKLSFLKLDATAPDPTKPHKFVSPADTGATATEADAVFVPVSSLQSLGSMSVPRDLLKRTDKVALVAPIDSTDFAQFERVTDEDGTYTITFVDKLRPGSYTFLWYVGMCA